MRADEKARRSRLARLVIDDLGIEAWDLVEARAPLGGHAVWFAYFDEAAMGMPVFRTYLVAPQERGAWRVPSETNRGRCAWSGDGRYAAFCSNDPRCLSFWDTAIDQVARQALERVYGYEIAFDGPARLRAQLDSAFYKFSLMPKIVELDMSALDWRPPDPASRLSAGAGD